MTGSILIHLRAWILMTLTCVGSSTLAQVAAQSPASASATLSLDDAVSRAQVNEAGYAASRAESQTAALDRSIARAGLLPSATFHNQYLFTQGNGSSDRIGQTTTSSAPRFIANNAVHEYASQLSVNETVGFAQFAAVSLADANAARVAAELEIARRGLVAGVVRLYYAVAASETKLGNAQRALQEANEFLKLTQQRESAREAAHADVLKAELQQEQRARDVADARLAFSNAHLELGVLLYADPRTSFMTDASAPAPLPERAEVNAAAAANNAELKSALASVQASEAGVKAAQAAYLPDLALNVTYGVDAPQLAVNGPYGTRNLGYSAFATLDIPVWDWLATRHKVQQSQIQRDAAKVALTAAQRRLIANLDEFYDEAAAACDQLRSFDHSVVLAEESLRLTRLRYTGGEGTVLEVVDAEGSLVTAENARADGVVRYRVALANLQTLTGRF